MGHKTDMREISKRSPRRGPVERLISPCDGMTGFRHILDAMIGEIVQLGVNPDATPANTPRNPKFGRAAKLWLADKKCIVCGGKKKLQAHHKYPFHLFPSLEMDERYWRPLCEGDHRLNCHLIAGHAGNFAGVNLLVDEFAGLLNFALRTNSVLLHAIRQEIKANKRKAAA